MTLWMQCLAPYLLVPLVAEVDLESPSVNAMVYLLVLKAEVDLESPSVNAMTYLLVLKACFHLRHLLGVFFLFPLIRLIPVWEDALHPLMRQA